MIAPQSEITSSTPNTTAQIRAYVETVLAVSEAIRELKKVPAGHLYARLMAHMKLQTFDGIIKHLTDAGVVRREASHMLVWVGPASENACKPQPVALKQPATCQ